MKFKTVNGEEIELGHRFKDLTGEKYGRLTVVGLSHMNKKRSAYWLCQCECGEQKVVVGSNLRSGHTTSCGCAQREATSLANAKHRLCGHPAYSTWAGMVQRCTNPGNKHYPYYGGRGIKVCEQWLEFEGFWKDTGPTWEGGLTLDRIDVNGNYCPENCRWTTVTMQARNKGIQENNTSGVTGVSFSKERNRWVAQWQDMHKKQHGKYFSVNKYGYDKAFLLACEFRYKMIAELNAQGAGYTEGHGK